MNLKSDTFLSDLIGTGPDASLNLYSVSFSKSDMKFLSARTTKFQSPTRDSLSVSLPYQNVTIEIPTPGTSIPKTLSLDLRIDSEYSVYNKLRSLQLINENGEYIKDENKRIDSVTVDALEPSSNNNYITKYTWKFHEVYLLKVSPLAFSYESGNTANCNVTLVWKYYDEFPAEGSYIGAMDQHGQGSDSFRPQ